MYAFNLYLKRINRKTINKSFKLSIEWQKIDRVFKEKKCRQKSNFI